MSLEEMRDYCQGLSQFKLRVEVRLKNGREIMKGSITKVEAERFDFTGDDKVVQQLRYAWIACIKNA